MIKSQEYVLLKNVKGYTLDHLIHAITKNELPAYCDPPKFCRFYLEGPFHDYVRIVNPVYKDGENLIFGKIEVLNAKGVTIETQKACYTAPIDEIRICMKDISEQEECIQEDISPVIGSCDGPGNTDEQHVPIEETPKVYAHRRKSEGAEMKVIAAELASKFFEESGKPLQFGRISEILEPGRYNENQNDARRQNGRRLAKAGGYAVNR